MEDQTAISTLIANGADLFTTAAELGHATATTTANIYAYQVARARAEAADIHAGVFATLDKMRETNTTWIVQIQVVDLL